MSGELIFSGMLLLIVLVALLAQNARLRQRSRKPSRAGRSKRHLWLLSLLLLAGCGPRLAYVDPDRAFVFGDGGQAVLVLEDGEYALEGSALPAGCYRLETPYGSPRGTAVYSGKDGCQ